MRRVERTRLERRRRALLASGLWFALGALTAGTLIWRVDQLTASRATEERTGSPEAVANARDGAQHGPAAEPTAASARVHARETETGTSGVAGNADFSALLKRRRLEMPVQGVPRGALRDTFDDRRAAVRKHEAIDIVAPHGTPVVAVENGRIAKLFTSVAGGLTVYVFDESEMFSYYYAHLQRYAPGLREGQTVRRGELIGYVGSTGNASDDAPHLHFAIFHLNSERQWWKGDPINPFPVLR